MIPLTDPQWSNFQANYSDGGHVASLLSQAESHEPLDDWYDELFQELCHQYTVSEAAFPAGPHLVRLAMALEESKKPLLILLGACHAFSSPPISHSLPTEIMEEWRSSAK